MTGISLVTMIALVAVCISLVTCAPAVFSNDQDLNSTTSAAEVNNNDSVVYSEREHSVKFGNTNESDVNFRNGIDSNNESVNSTDDVNNETGTSNRTYMYMPAFEQVDDDISSLGTISSQQKNSTSVQEGVSEPPPRRDNTAMLTEPHRGPESKSDVENKPDIAPNAAASEKIEIHSTSEFIGVKQNDSQVAIGVPGKYAREVDGDIAHDNDEMELDSNQADHNELDDEDDDDVDEDEVEEDNQYDNDFIEEDYGVSASKVHADMKMGNSHSDTESTGPDAMTLSDDVIIDALFTNLDILQDNIEMCEEGLRQKLSLFHSSSSGAMKTYTNEQVSKIIRGDVDGMMVEKDGPIDDSNEAEDKKVDDGRRDEDFVDDGSRQVADIIENGSKQDDEIVDDDSRRDSDILDNKRDKDNVVDDDADQNGSFRKQTSHHNKNDEKEDTRNEDHDILDDIFSNEGTQDNADINDPSSIDIDGRDSDRNSSIIANSPQVDESQPQNSNNSKGQSHSGARAQADSPPTATMAKTRKRRSPRGDNKENSVPNGANKSNISSMSIDLDHSKASHDVVMRLSNRLHYLKESLQQCYFLYKQISNSEFTTE